MRRSIKRFMKGVAFTGCVLALPVTVQAQSSIDADLGLGSPQESARKAPPKRTVIIPAPDAPRPAGAAWSSSAKQVPESVQGYPYYTMAGLFAAVCNAPYTRAQTDCKDMSSVQALGALQMMMYYGNLIGPDSVLVVIPKSKLGVVAGKNGDMKLNEMTRAFRAKNTRQAAVAPAN